MSHLLQLGIPQNAAGSLDRVDRAKDLGQQLARRRIPLQRYQVAIQQIKTFGALNQKLLDDFIHSFEVC